MTRKICPNGEKTAKNGYLYAPHSVKITFQKVTFRKRIH